MHGDDHGNWRLIMNNEDCKIGLMGYSNHGIIINNRDCVREMWINDPQCHFYTSGYAVKTMPWSHMVTLFEVTPFVLDFENPQSW